MTTVDDAVEAGAQVVGTYYAHEYAYHALIGAWPVLSAGLREPHGEGLPRGRYPGDSERHTFCTHCRGHWPCATIQELDRIDKGLGL